MWTPTDPEGLFTTLNSFTNTFIGITFTLVMQKFKASKPQLLKAWSIMSVALIGFGYLWLIFIPFNK